MGKERIITLTTDFGDESGYAGVMKGVILTVNPDCQIIDITHRVSQQDVEEAAFLLNNSFSYFPEHSIHVVVVDPGVGSERKPILVETDKYWFVGPDNGVFSFMFLMEGFKKVWEITNESYFLPEVSSTFHGRDIFAPVAAHLSLGVSAEELGKELKGFVMLKDLEPKVEAGVIKARVVYADHFGNLISNISKDLFSRLVADKSFNISVGGEMIQKLSLSYADVRDGEVLALFGSSQWLEISVKNGNCQKELDIKKGAEINILVSQ
ncbi:MAG: SAM-dependent chlorinase/fluorinase [Deltaproteobacteria bacterium]|nr:SAM-dependent chlorinase/fluorinase [Deltaproteobacteria bacterium]